MGLAILPFTTDASPSYATAATADNPFIVGGYSFPHLLTIMFPFTISNTLGSIDPMVILKLAHDRVAQGKLALQTDQSKVEGATKYSKEEKGYQIFKGGKEKGCC